MRATLQKNTTKAEPKKAGRQKAVKSAKQHLLTLPAWTNALLIQTSLKVNTPGDQYEQEADRVADQVMRMPVEGIQNKTCACGKPMGPDGMCEDCKRKQLGIQRMTKGEGGQTAAPPIVHQVINQPGRALDTSTRNFMESRFGRDFSRIRIHTGPSADLANQAVQASAFTVGNDVVFGQSQYRPRTTTGGRLLAHELAHVVQQTSPASGSAPGIIQRACLPDSACKVPPQTTGRTGSAKKYGEEVAEQAKPLKEKKRSQTVEQARSGMHSRRATAIEQLFQKHLPGLRLLVHGVFVDETLPESVGAMHGKCQDWANDTLPSGTRVPEFEGAVRGCVFFSAKREKEAAQYLGVANPTPELQGY